MRRTDFLVPDVLEVAPARSPQPLPAGVERGTRTIALTDAEREELRLRSSQSWRTPGPILFVLGYFALGLVMSRVGGGRWWEHYRLQFIGAGVLALLAVVAMIVRVRTAMNLARDAAWGEALEIVEPDENGELHRVVVLSESQMVWSVDDLPGEWRSKRL